MSNFSRWRSQTAAFMALSVTAGAVAPLFATAPTFAQTTFSDVSSNYWARGFIQELAQRDIIAGFPDGSFRPEQPVTRAQFAAMLRKAFEKAEQRASIRFTDVPQDYWAYDAIQESYTTGFLAGYPSNQFRPNQNIPREQVLVSLANGLKYSASGSTSEILNYYSDAAAISNYAQSPIAAATERQIVVNYPNVRFLNPGATTTRAQVAAFIYQALVSSEQATAINSPYVVALEGSDDNEQPQAVTIPDGTNIPVKYDQAERILVTKEETAPLTLTVSQNIVTEQGNVLIPAGAQVVGDLRPSQEGSQFVAKELVLQNGQRYDFSATSEVITKTEQIRKGASVGAVVKNAALGAAAAAAISAVTGDRDITAGEVLGGAGIGSLIGLFLGRSSVDLVAIDPNTDLELTLGQDLTISLAD